MIFLQQIEDDFFILVETVGDVSIYKDVSWDQYVCQLRGDPEADYFTDCLKDARKTAQKMRSQS